LVALVAAPRLAGAHGMPIALTFWGDFPLPVARCQRVIGRAAAVCGLRVWRARRDCALAPLRGAGCDQAAADAATEAARLAAIDDVSGGCNDFQLSNLQFLDLREAQSDVIRFCRELEAAATSLVLEPLAAATPADLAQCGAPTASATTKLFGMAFRSRQQVLDRIAASAIPARGKLPMVAASSASIDDTAARLAASVVAGCPAERFAAVYGREPAALFAAAAVRADCLAGNAYAQGTLLCPAAVCGNRIREGGEECDDGNTDDGDGCSASCFRESGGE
jgi:cysteine-rich repeat protein